MKFIDWFAGIGGFRRGMELAGHECVGFCEFDKYAAMSYTSMHLATDAQRQYLKSLDFRARQKEVLKEEYRNGEWYSDDIRTVDARSLPGAECWCFGFPCQDISVAGSMRGFQGNRSSLFFRVTYLLGQLSEEERPHTLFIENVKNLLGINGGWDFARLLIELDKVGYDAEWSVLNSKDFHVPQNRERCFIVGHLRGHSRTEVFPIEGTDGENRVHGIGHRNGYRRNTQVFDPDGITEALDTAQGGGRGHHTIEIVGTLDPKRHSQMDILDPDGICATLDTINEKKKVAVNVNNDRSSDEHESMFVELPDGVVVYAIWYPKKQKYIAIRKLTPRECFRLQGWSDDYFDRAVLVNSDSQLYKQAGNGVTVNVIEAIAKKIG